VVAAWLRSKTSKAIDPVVENGDDDDDDAIVILLIFYSILFLF
jgi:hypothetical protein